MSTASEQAAVDVSKEVKNAIEAKRETLERVANSEYPIAEHAEALLEITESYD